MGLGWFWIGVKFFGLWGSCCFVIVVYVGIFFWLYRDLGFFEKKWGFYFFFWFIFNDVFWNFYKKRII